MLSVNILLINVSAGALLFPWQLSAEKNEAGAKMASDGAQTSISATP